MKHSTEIVTTVERWEQLVTNSPLKVVADVETFRKDPNLVDAKLLGVAIAFQVQDALPTAFYVPFWSYNAAASSWHPEGSPFLALRVAGFLSSKALIGHNTEYDRLWLDHFCKSETKWHADTRKMWHLADGKDSRHGFSLKTAQVELLGWGESNEVELEKAVEELGGRLSSGDHYLAPVDLLGRYASLDALSTLLVYKHLSPFFDANDYWGFLEWRQAYHPILTEATRGGVGVDAELLLDAKEQLSLDKENAFVRIGEVCKNEIEAIERRWAFQKAASLKREKNRTKYIADKSRWAKFNPNSSHDRAELFHDYLAIPIVAKTPGGRPKTDRSTIALFNHPSAEAFVRYSEAEAVFKLAKSYTESLQLLPNGEARIHFPYDTSATVSDRLGGFKPYALNMPFSEERLMSAFKIDPGFIGVHADLSALEPCLIAAFSQDPTLLKVHRDGLGDVYLDFALIAFPENVELRQLYNPNAPPEDAVKKHFKDIRNICKICHLAIGYTGTESTVFKSIQKAGFPITKPQAKALVAKYWTLFGKVQDLDFKLRRLHKRNGSIRNIAGRILKVPEEFEKDTMNRFIQSSGHDVLTMWVKEIDALRKLSPEIQMSPVLPDIHDSTSWQCKEEFYAKGVWIFEDALRRVNSRLGLAVRLRADVKPFRTFAGLKGDSGT